jgi:hypothetical protein
MPVDEGNDRPFLFIQSYPPPTVPLPAYPVDVGARPVPPGVCWYLCPGIRPLTAFQPGADLTVQVTIGNWQGGNSDSIAYVRVWWSPPVSGPVIPDPAKFIGFATVAVPPHGGQVVSAPLTRRIPPDSGDHICLLAMVGHPLDASGTPVADPINDRHWAQHNLAVIPAGGPGQLMFLATNPLTEPFRYEVRIRPVGPDQWTGFAFEAPLVPARTPARLLLRDLAEGNEVAGQMELTQTVALEPQEQRELQLTIEPTEPLEPGTFAPFEVIQFADERPAGGIGIALVAG